MTNNTDREARRAARERARVERAQASADRATDGKQQPRGATVEDSFDTAGLESIAINHTAGKLTVRTAEEAGAGLVSSRGSKAAPRLELKRSGTHLEINVQLSAGRLFRRRQGADTSVTVPRGLAELVIDQGAGRVDIEGIDAQQLRLDTGAGEVLVRDSAADLRVDVGAGKVTVTGHRGTARLETGTGDAVLEVASAPPGEYRVGVGMGSAEVRLPPGLEVSARLHSGVGKTRSDYPLAAAGAPINVSVNTGIGRAILRQLDASPAASASPKQRSSGQRGSSRPRAAATGETEEYRVLQLLEQGRISPREAADLIAALKGMPPPGETDDEDRD